MSVVTPAGPDPGPVAVPGSCRLTVHGPLRRFDLVVPGDIPIIDLLPTVVAHAGDDLDESGIAHGGWVLQRLGQEPLEPSGTVTSLGLRDGDLLLLRARQDALPAVHFDDLVDGVMSTLAGRSDSWRPAFSARLLGGCVMAVFALAVALLLVPPVRFGAGLVAAAAGLLLLACAGAASRVLEQAVPALLLGVQVVALWAGAAGLLTVAAGGAHAQVCLLAVGGGASAAAAAVVAVVGRAVPLFTGIGAAGVLAGLAGLPIVEAPAHAAALTATVIVLAHIFVAGWSFWLSGLRLPPLPANAEQLQEGIDPHPGPVVAERAVLVDRYLIGLLVALGTGYAGALVVLALTGDGVPALVMCAVLAVLGILHGRTMGGLWQRLAVVLPGVIGLAALVFRIASNLDAGARCAIAGALIGIGIGLLVASATVPGRRMVPHWARAAELAHTLAAASVLPLLMLTLGLYHFLRGLAG